MYHTFTTHAFQVYILLALDYYPNPPILSNIYHTFTTPAFQVYILLALDRYVATPVVETITEVDAFWKLLLLWGKLV